MPTDEVKRYPNEGWLYLGQNEKRHPEVDAILYRDQTKTLELLRLKHAHVKKIDRGGVMLYGRDAHVEKHQPQVWRAVLSIRLPIPPHLSGRDWRTESLKQATRDITKMSRAMGKMQ